MRVIKPIVILLLICSLLQECEPIGLYGLGMSLSGMLGSGVGTAMTITHALSMAMMHSVLQAMYMTVAHGFSTINTMVMSIAGGFVMGNIALAAFIVFLLVLVPAEEARALSSHSIHKRSVVNSTVNIETILSSTRTGRFISRLVQNDPLNCMPLIMCGLSAAETPSERTDVINDYAYMFKHFLEPDGEEKSDEDDEAPVAEYRGSAVKKKPTVEDAIDAIEKEEDENIEDLVLTEMSDDPNDLPFALEEMKRKGLRKTVEHMTPMSKVAYLESLVDSDEEEDQPSLRSGNRQVPPRLFKGYPPPPPLPQIMKRRSSNRAALSRIRRSVRNATTIHERSILGVRAGRAVQNARQCRSLFQECPVNTIAKGDGDQPFINRAVNNLRRVLLGTSAQSSSLKRVSEIKQVIDTLQPKHSGSEVKVVLNISPPGSPGQPVSLTQPSKISQPRPPSLLSSALSQRQPSVATLYADDAPKKKPMTYHVPKSSTTAKPPLDYDSLEDFLRSTDIPPTDMPKPSEIANKTVYEGNIRETIGIFNRFKEASRVTTVRPKRKPDLDTEQHDVPSVAKKPTKTPKPSIDEPEDNINAIVGFIKQLRKRNKKCKGKKKCKWNKKNHSDDSSEESSSSEEEYSYRPPTLVAVPHPTDKFKIQWKSSSSMFKHGIYHLLFAKNEAKPLTHPPVRFRSDGVKSRARKHQQKGQKEPPRKSNKGNKSQAELRSSVRKKPQKSQKGKKSPSTGRSSQRVILSLDSHNPPRDVSPTSPQLVFSPFV